jgi:multiple sugar transport system substrate-binding protein
MELNVGLIAGPIYNELYQRLDVFTSKTGIHVNIVLHEPQHTLNASLLDNYASREPAMPLDLITCHSKYAPSQSHFLLPLDDLLDPEEIRAFTPAMIEFARVGGQLVQLPRNCDVKLLMYRRDVLESPGVWGSSRAKIEVPSSCAGATKGRM